MIHVIGRNREAVLSMNCQGDPPELRESFGFRLREANEIAEALKAAIPALCEEWSKVHGSY
jgi:hypothetical protein